MQAANYDTGGQGTAYNVTSVNGTGNSYRSDGVDLEACTDTGCGDDIGWTGTGQWFKYTVNAATARSYTVTLRLASPSGVTDGLHIASSAGRQPVREHQRPGHRRLADLDHGHGDGHLAGRAADPDHRPGQRRLEHPPAHLRLVSGPQRPSKITGFGSSPRASASARAARPRAASAVA